MNKTLFKSRLCCIIAVLATLFAFMPTAKANPVTLEKAKLKAQQFLTANRAKSNSLNGKQTAVTFDLAYEAKTDDKNASCFYVLNESSDGGYIIVSADDRLPDVLGYSDNGAFDPNNAPDNMKWWLSEYERQINQLLSTDKGEVATIDNTSFRDGWSEIEPLIKTKWDQRSPYYNLCPRVDGNPTSTGCVATVMAQIMNYYKWPEHGRGSNSYEWNGQTLSMDFSQTTFDWNNMQDTYSTNDSPTAQNAVATLMYACGIGANMNYGRSESAAFNTDALNALQKNFDYNAQYLNRYSMKLENWENLIYNELANKRPVYYSGLSISGAHAFVCDGYSNDGLFHINWGWGGFCDGYFLLDVLDPYNEGLAGAESADGYKYEQLIIYGICPKTYDTPDIAINAENFPDENFRNWLLEQEYGQDGVITGYEIADIDEINVNDKGIRSLEGIQNFIYLITLDCNNNQLTNLDISDHTALTTLRCYNNQLTSLDVTNNTALTYLYCHENQLTSLDLTHNTILISLLCEDNQLTSLDVSNNTALTELRCDNNQLTTLDVSDCTALERLNCYYNQLTSLDVSDHTALTLLYCYNNQLTSLNVSGCTALERLNCYNNQIYGENMDKFISTLPNREGIIHIYNNISRPESNICTKRQVATIKGKGWTPYYWSGYDWLEYEGSDDLDGIIANETEYGAGIAANAVAYDLNGRRVEDWQNMKGVYIVNGKKVVVK